MHSPNISNNYKKRFVIVTLPRSGSYFFQSLLNSAEDIICHPEIFKKRRVEISAWHRHKLSIENWEDVAARDNDPINFLNRLRDLNPYNVFGFKAFFIEQFQPRPDLRKNILESRDWKKIFLIRNPVYTYASLLRAKSSGEWTLKNNKPKTSSSKQVVVFEQSELVKHLNHYAIIIKAYEKCVSTHDSDCILLEYHQLHNLETLSKILEFIGSSTEISKLKIDYKRQYEADISESFVNFHELESYLADIGRKELLDDSRDFFLVKQNV